MGIPESESLIQINSETNDIDPDLVAAQTILEAQFPDEYPRDPEPKPIVLAPS